jgi:hypothetical protein
MGSPDKRGEEVRHIHDCSYAVQFPVPYGLNGRMYDLAFQSLAKLHIVPSSSPKVALNPTFKASLRQAITGRSDLFDYPRSAKA